MIRFVPKWPFGKSVLITSQKMEGKTKTVLTGKRSERYCLHLSNRSRTKRGFLWLFQLTAIKGFGA